MADKKDSTRELRPFIGEYDASTHGSTVYAARVLFLEMVRAYVPEVLETLLSDVAPSYPEYLSHEPEEHERWRRGEGKAAVGGFPELRRWAEHWHLNVDWVHEAALLTLAADRSSQTRGVAPTGRGTTPQWMNNGLAYMPPATDAEVQHSPELACQLPTYKPWCQGRKRAEDAIRAAFEAYLTDYLDGMELLLQERGWFRATKREQKHFAWLALYQVKGLTYEQVAQCAQHWATKGSCDVPAAHAARDVKRAIIDVAKLVGLKLRGTSGPRPRASPPPVRKRGRPLGSKNVPH